MKMLLNNLSGKILPVFILGIERSGTTLLLSLMDGHPELLTDVGESRFFNRYYPATRRKQYNQCIRIAERHLLHMFDPNGIYYQKFLRHIPEQDVRRFFKELLQQSNKEPKDFLEAYIFGIGLASKCLTKNTRYWVEKTPGNEFHLDKITSWWPEVRLIHMVRDPRDVYASYVIRDQKNNRPTTKLESFIFRWGKSIRQYEKYVKRIGKEHYVLIKYEDLVGKHSRTMEILRGFLGIADDPKIHLPTKGFGKIPWGGNPAKGKKKSYIYHSAINKWKNTLSESQVRLIEGMLKNEMALAGYQPINELDSIRPTFFDHLNIWMREIKHQARILGLSK